MKITAMHVSGLKLERYVLGELPVEEINEMRNLINSDSALAARYEAILKSNEEILSLYPPEGMAIKIQWKHNQEAALDKKRNKDFILRTLSFAGVFLSLFILIFVLIPKERLSFYPDYQDDIIRPKGDTSIKIYRKTEKGAELLTSGVSVKKGSRFQIKYFAADQKYGIIFSIDGNGYITLHFPYSKEESPLLDKGGEVALFESFRLDDAPGFERFFFVTSNEPFEPDEVLEAGRRLAEDSEKAKTQNLDLPWGYKQDSFILLKEGF